MTFSAIFAFSAVNSYGKLSAALAGVGGTFPHKRIGASFFPDSRGRPMSRINLNMIANYKQLFADTLLERLKAASRKIGAADGACK